MGSYDTLTEDLQQKVLTRLSILDLVRLSACSKELQQFCLQNLKVNFSTRLLVVTKLAAQTAAADSQGHAQHMHELEYLLDTVNDTASVVNSNVEAFLNISPMPEDTAVLLITKGRLSIPFSNFIQAAWNCIPGVVVWARAYRSSGTQSNFGLLVEDVCCSDLTDPHVCYAIGRKVCTKTAWNCTALQH